MAIIQDIDLLVIEPSVFIDAAAGATSLLAATDGAVSGTTLTSAGSDFTANDIDLGSVVVVNGEALEVIQRVDLNTLEISRPRAADTDPQIAPGDGSALAVDVSTFARLIDLSQSWLLSAMGIDSADPETPLDELAVVNVDAVGRVVAIQTIAQAYSLAAARAPTDDVLAAVAEHYARTAREARIQAAVVLDTDGDGVGDATRHLAAPAAQRS